MNGFPFFEPLRIQMRGGFLYNKPQIPFIGVSKQRSRRTKKNMTKKTILVVAGSMIALSLLTSLVSAQTSSSTMTGTTPSVKMMVQINASGHATVSGAVAAVQNTSFTVTSWGGVWTINLGSSAKIVRRFGGTSNLSEFAPGDYVTITGTANQSASWTIDADTVRNMSIQTRNAYFSGTISNLNGTTFTLTTQARGNIAVTVPSDAKVMVNGQTSSASSLMNGMTAVVSGVWDRNQSTVSATNVKARTPKTSTGGTTGNATSTPTTGGY